MKKLPVWPALFALAMMCVFSAAALAQNQGAGRGNAPAGNAPAGNAQAGRGRGGPIAGPPHDPHDLNGVWNLRGFGAGGMFPGSPPPKLTAFGQELFKKAKSSNSGEYTLKETNDPVITRCLPPGTPRIYLQPFPWQIVQTPKEVLFLYEYDHTVRHIFLDRKHPDDPLQTYMGDSVGSWDGDLFVVDTIGFNDATWLDRAGHGHSDQLHVVERFHRVNQNDLELDIRMEDPKVLAEPWNVHLQFEYKPNWTISEQNCADNADFVNFEK